VIQKAFDMIGKLDNTLLFANAFNRPNTLEYKQMLPLNTNDDKKMSRRLGEALDRNPSAIFDHARGLRNQSGHPTGENVSAEDAEAGLLLFPGFCELADKIVEELSKIEPVVEETTDG
jgi:hypothetical protein